MTKLINQPTEAIAAALTRWTRNRDMISGEDAVKLGGEVHLPRVAGQKPAEYAKYLARTPFFPGAGRTHDGLLGLVTRKNGVLQGHEGLEDVFDTITYSGHTVADLVEEVFSETLKTGFTGLLIDMPVPTGDVVLTKANEIDEGFRPFVALYQAEAILEVTPAVVRNRQIIARVRLLEDNGMTVRELLLDNGVYVVVVHRNIEGNWVEEAPVIPMKAGKPLTEIPFVLVTPKARTFDPVKGPMDDICIANGHLYREMADAKNSRFWSSAPLLTLIGAKPPASLMTGPGTLVAFPDSTPEKPVTFKFTEFSGAGQTALENAVRDFKDDMAKLGSNILASEKSAAEAAETHAIRRSSENAVLASLARTVGRKIEDALNWVAWWTGRDIRTKPVKFELNTDFVPTPMTAQEIASSLAMLQAGAISHDTFLNILISGEVLPDSFDKEEEVQRLAVEAANVDRPTAEIEEPVPPVEMPLQ